MNRLAFSKWTAPVQAAIAIAAACAACSGSSSGGKGGGSDDGSSTSSSSSGGDAQSADGTSPASDATSSSSSSSSSSGSPDSGPADAAHDQSSSCFSDDMCLGGACCPRTSATCGTFTLTPTTVFDSSTNITWMRNFADDTDYPTAKMECTTWGGRIPNDSELANYAQEQVACSGQVMWARPESTACVWSSTAYDGGGAHDCVFFTGAAPGTASDGDSHYVLCVK